MAYQSNILPSADFINMTNGIDASLHPWRRNIIAGYCDSLFMRFERYGSLHDMDLVIETLETAMKTAEDPSSLHFLYQIIQAYGMRFSRSKSRHALDACIVQASREAKKPHKDPTVKTDLEAELGNLYGLRFEDSGRGQDLDDAILCFEQAIKAMPGDYPRRAIRLGEFSKKLAQRFDKTGSLDDINKAIKYSNEAKNASSKGSPNYIRNLHNLGVFMGRKYEQTRLVGDIKDAVKALQDAKQGGEEHNDPQLPSLLTSLAYQLWRKSVAEPCPADLEDALDIMRGLMESSPKNMDQAMSWNVMGLILGEKARNDDSLELLDESIKCFRMAIKSPGDARRGQYQGNLGDAAIKRFERTGSMADLDSAIDALQAATALLSESRRLGPGWFINLAQSLGRRYERIGDVRDLNGAINAATQAVDLTPVGNRVENRKNILGFWLATRHARLGDKNDIELAIHHTEGALAKLDEAIAAGDSSLAGERHEYVGNLANHHGRRYLQLGYFESGDFHDIDKAIELAREATAVDSNHPKRGAHFSDLGNWLGWRYEKTHHESDLIEAVESQQIAAASVPANHPSKASFLLNLCRVLFLQYEKDDSDENRDLVLACCKEGWECINANTSTRIRLAEQAARVYASMGDWSQASLYLEEALRLVPMLSPRSLYSTDKQFMLQSFSGLGARAAEAALSSGKGELHALGLLESGRDIINGLLMEVREDLIEIQQHDSGLAERFSQLRDELEILTSSSSISPDTADTVLEKRTRHYRETEQKFKDTIEEIRACPGLSRFLLGPSREELLEAARPGPIVVLNASTHRCDAFIIKCDKLSCISLPSLNLQEITENMSRMQQGVATRKSLDAELEWLWKCVAEPCLKELGFEDAAVDDKWPHVWWIATGPLSRFPIHAAGLNQRNGTASVLDRVISSYSSSIKALIHSRRRVRSDSGKIEDSFRSAVLVAMADTPGSSPLPFAGDEVEMLQKQCPLLHLRPEMPEPYTDAVLGAMKTCTVFHFAGHGSAQFANPSDSCLLLKDWQSNALTVDRLHGIHIQDSRPFLAYLSACETKASDKVQLLDESLDLASAFQLAGFRHVVGTLWVVSDQRCVDVAKEFYQVIQNEGWTDTSISRGLHFAIRKSEARSGEMDESHFSPREHRHDEVRTRRLVAKRHQCPKPGCGKSFSRPSHLARHALNHSAVEFECPRCAASFKRRDLLERHKARHASKDRLAGGLGLGILRTKRHRRGRLIMASSSSRVQPLASSQDQAATVTMGQPGADTISSVIPEHVGVSGSDESTVGNFQQTTERSASFNGGTSAEPHQGILSTDGFDFLELGDMYHDSTFDFMHFNVTGDPHSPETIQYLSLEPAQDDSPVLPPKSLDFGQEDQSSQDAPILHYRAHDIEANETSSNSAEVDSLCSLGRLGLNNLHLTETKRAEILGLINDMRPVYPDGTSIDERTANLSLARMQGYLDSFFANFNSCYPMIHTPTLEILDAEPLFLLSSIGLGATYKEKEDHQLSVCLYDAMTPYIISGLSGIKVPDLSILQAFMVLESYGMYRAGAYQRENAIIMHTFLFNAIRRLSRYHVRARIMVTDLRADREKDWKAFAYLEQYKRLILFIFMWDTQNVSYYSFMPSMSNQSIQVNLPCSKELWEAKDENAWKAIISKSDPPMINSMVKDFFEDGGNIWCETLDSLSLSFILHGLMSMCNDMVHFHNQSIYLGNAAQGADNDWRCRMTTALELWKTKYNACAMGTRQAIDEDSPLHEFRQENVAFLALYHTAHIVANADIRHLQIAAGAEAIFGHVVTSTERAESTKVVMDWVRLSPDSARHAAWHAAQMIREGLLNLRNWKADGMFHYPWCLYIGVLTTWAFVYFSQGQNDNRRGCHRSVGGEDILQTQSKALMHQTMSNMASCTPATIGRDLHRCCPHGLAIEVAKYLKTVRWTAAFEAMKVLEGIVEMESL
ncbi:C2H2 zinc finger [Fusarium phyllophilum]|uniref:C2H2 zinc finger n=1 Tax=Fusarium phyllophilum TaxID=47803 RepID=A0A8H5K7R4_9HYPO|nr:C2H2 zinc finger [Fusarium phyllophilum]